MAILLMYADQRTRSVSIRASPPTEQAESYVRPSVDKSAVLKYAQRAQVDLDAHHFTAATQISRRYCDHNVNACLGCRRPEIHPLWTFISFPVSPAVCSFPSSTLTSRT